MRFSLSHSKLPFWIARCGVLLLICLCSVQHNSAAAKHRAVKTAEETGCHEEVPEIFSRVSPAVVYIAATAINPYRLSDRVSHTIGSGVIFDASGLILTNSHVALGPQVITVTLDDGTNLPAQLVGADPIFDIAVLRIPPPREGQLPVATPGDSDSVHVGEEVLAIGNPLGLDQTLTRGIVSALNRILPETPFSAQEPLIQTDTPINPGNSGGPLLDRCGRIIGINTLIIPDAENIGFAIPINLVKSVLPSLISEGHVMRPWIGFHGQFINKGLQNLFKLPLVQGFLVEAVEPGSPAEKAGIQGGQFEVVISGTEYLFGGDIITQIDGTDVDTPEKLTDAMRALTIGALVNLKVFRKGEYRDVEYVLPERPILPEDLPNSRSVLRLNDLKWPVYSRPRHDKAVKRNQTDRPEEKE
jgi:serine protease Do